MRYIYTLLLVLVQSSVVLAQTMPLFQVTKQKFPAKAMVSGEFSGDSLSDAFICFQTPDGFQDTFALLKNTGADTFSLQTIPMPKLTSSQLSVVDYNHDGLADVFVLGLSADGSLEGYFLSHPIADQPPVPVTLPTLSPQKHWWADLDGNGWDDLIVSGSNNGQAASHILLANADNLTAIDHPFATTAIEQFLTIPYAYKPSEFYLITAPETAEIPNGGLYSFLPDSSWRPERKLPALWEGSAALGDLNHDGYWDVLLNGRDSTGLVYDIFLGQENTFNPQQASLPNELISATTMQLADLNHDGLADLLGITKEGKVLFAQNTSSSSPAFGAASALGMADGMVLSDVSQDLNPDLFFLQEDSLQLLINTTPTANEAPVPPAAFLVLPLANDYLISWSAGNDDVTSEAAITYGLMAGTTAQPQAFYSTFYVDAISRRTIQNMGRGGSLGSALLRQKNLPGSFTLGITAIDNAWQSGAALSGYCRPGEISVAGCIEQLSADTLLCSPTNLHLTSAFNFEASVWYSYRHGFLGEGSSAWYMATESDVVYGIYSEGDCIRYLAATIQLKGSLPPKAELLNACLKAGIAIPSLPQADSTQWFSGNGSLLATADTLRYTVTQNDTLTRLSFSQGCTFPSWFIIHPYSLPELQTSGDVSIQFGQEVQLNAWGAEQYIWSPATGLNNAQIASPIASPATTTTYTVRAINQYGCTQTDSLTVTVLNSLFIPSLFSPNQDGNNDYFKVFGSGVQEFRLLIHDRNGKLVYEAPDFETAKNIGWNGTWQRQPLPAGLYLWSVSGSFADGSPLTFNGKTSGQLTLIR